MPRGHRYHPILRSLPDSERLNSVSEGAALLYCLLICGTDDLGRYWGDGSIVAAKLMTRRLVAGEVTGEGVERRLVELAEAGLLRRYERGGSVYLELADIYRPIKSDRKAQPEYPDPPSGNEWIQSGSNLDPTWIQGGSSPDPQHNTTQQENNSTQLKHAPSAPPPGGSVAPAKKGPRKLTPDEEAARREFTDGWLALWSEYRLGSEYRLAAKDRAAIRKVLGLASWDAQEALRRAERLLGSEDSWIAQNASLGLLESRWNSMAVEVRKRSSDDDLSDWVRRKAGA